MQERADELDLYSSSTTTVFTSQNSMFARLGTDYEIRNQWVFAILEAMTTDLDLS